MSTESVSPFTDDTRKLDPKNIAIGVAVTFGYAAVCYFGGRLLGAAVMNRLIKQEDNCPTES